VDFANLPIVGREEIQEMVRLGLASAVDGRGSTLLPVGERGLGKTRLCRWAREEGERRGFRVAAGRSHEAESGLSYSLVSDTFLPLLRDLPAETLDALTRGRTRELDSLLPGLSVARGVPDPGERTTLAEARVRSLWAFSELLARLAERDPLLVVMEDLQWADPSSLELLHFLARRIEDRPVLILLTREETLPGGSAPLAEMERSLVSHGLALEMVLAPLSREQTGLLVRGAFGLEEEAAKEFGDHLHRWTQGNPYFLEETLQSLVRSGQLYRKGSAWLGWEVRDFQLPLTVREAVLARVAHLTGDARGVAELAAVLGDGVPFQLLGVLSPLPESELLGHLHDQVAGGILTERLERGEVVYEFRQTLIKETLLRELGLAQAQILHGRVARRLEEHFGAQARDQADLLAYHELRAGGHGTPDAAVYLVLAGRNALGRFGSAEASGYLAAALSLLEQEETEGKPPSPVEGGRPGVLRELAVALSEQGRYQEAVERWEEACRLAEEAGSPEDAAECRRQIGLIRVSRGRPGVALEEFDGILSSPPHTLSPGLRARVRLHRGVVLEQLGRPREASEELEGVLADPEAREDPSIAAEAHRVLFNLHMWVGDPERVRFHAAQALELARRAGDRTVAFWTYWGHAAFEGLMGNLGPMTDLVQEADRVAREVRSPLLELRRSELALELASAKGDWDTGIIAGEQAIALARALSQRTVLARVLVWTSLIYVGRGEVELARPLLREAWELAATGEEGTLNVHGAIPAHIGRAFLALGEGDFDEAARIGRAGLGMAERAGYRLWALHRLLPLLADVYLRKGDLEGIREMGGRLREDAEAVGHRPGLAWARACDAAVMLLEGGREEGVRLLGEAVTDLEGIPWWRDAQRLRLLRARHLAELGRKKEALEDMEVAHEAFLRMGAAAELEETRALFRQVGARPPRRAVPGDSVLSPREMEIARLVEQRRSNKAIARELGISPRTVSTHLSHIFQRLAIGSRGELADYLRGAGVPEE